MTTGTTITCVCGSQGFVVIHAITGEQIDLKTFYATQRKRAIDPGNLKSHDALDVSQLRMVCANPACRRVL